jgi:hypothetical protein
MNRPLQVERIGQQAEIDAEQHARDVLDATYRRHWQALLDQIYGLPYEPPRFAEVERVAAKYADGGQA